MITDYLKYVNDQAYVVKRETPTHMFHQKGKNKLKILPKWKPTIKIEKMIKHEFYK